MADRFSEDIIGLTKYSEHSCLVCAKYPHPSLTCHCSTSCNVSVSTAVTADYLVASAMSQLTQVCHVKGSTDPSCLDFVIYTLVC